MAICLLGINHKSAAVTVREKMAVAEQDYAQVIQRMLTQDAIDSVVVLSTCNRTEYYFSVSSVTEFENSMQQAFDFDVHAEGLYLKTGQSCASHLFAVTAGVDSLVIGETQIQGQVKRAFDVAKQQHINPELDKLFQMAFKSAKGVRSDTEIGQNPVSVAHCAVQLAKQMFGNLSKQRVLIIGAGETAELLIRYLQNHQATQISISNRTQINAERLAHHFNASVLPFEHLSDQLEQFDCVFAATASPVTLLKADDVANALKQRQYLPMVMIDLSVPRDFDPTIKELDDVFLYAVDDLEQVIAENINRRESTLHAAQRIIDAEATLYMEWLAARRHHNLLKQFQTQVDAIKSVVLSKHLKSDVSADEQEKYQAIAHQLSKKLTHKSISGIRQVIASGNREHIDLVAKIFDLEFDHDA